MPSTAPPENPSRGAMAGLLAAALFGASAPLSKRLLADCGPVVLAGLLYLGAGLGLSLVRLGARRNGEAALRLADLPLLLGSTWVGGIVGPVLLLVGLQQLSGVAAALLLNLEAPFTMVLAVALFREHLSPGEWSGAAVIVGGATVLSLEGSVGGGASSGVGALAVAGACLAWGFDNNLSQRLSLRDPVAVAQAKGFVAGISSLALGLGLGERAPPLSAVSGALGLGALTYGLSLVLHSRALRLLGAARQAAFFATAPFIGALLALPLLGERATWPEALGAALLLAGVLLLLRARHTHPHVHAALAHDHRHVHDAHHQHDHPTGQVVSGQQAHAHPHLHEPLTHDHPHVSDAHHRHRHG